MIKSGRGIDVYMVIEIHGRLCETGALEPGAYCTGSVLCAVAINGILVPHQFF